MKIGSKQNQLDDLQPEIDNLVKKYAEIAYEPKPFLAGQTAVPVLILL